MDRISISTVKRRLQRITQDQPHLPRRRGRKRTSKQLAAVPMVRIPWNEQEPGYVEVDLVHHCGPTLSGEHTCSFQMIDAATGWTGRAATLGRSYLVMEDVLVCLFPHLPFKLVEFHSDNGVAAHASRLPQPACVPLLGGDCPRSPAPPRKRLASMSRLTTRAVVAVPS